MGGYDSQLKYRFWSVCRVNASGEPARHHPRNVWYEPDHDNDYDDDDFDSNSEYDDGHDYDGHDCDDDEQPFGRVEAQDANWMMRLETKTEEALRHRGDVLQVLPNHQQQCHSGMYRRKSVFNPPANTTAAIIDQVCSTKVSKPKKTHPSWPIEQLCDLPVSPGDPSSISFDAQGCPLWASRHCLIDHSPDSSDSVGGLDGSDINDDDSDVNFNQDI